MAKIKTAEETTRNYVHGSLLVFLEEGRDLKWLLKVIGKSGVEDTGTTLAEIFAGLRGHGNRQRYEKAESACRQQGWLP